MASVRECENHLTGIKSGNNNTGFTLRRYLSVKSKCQNLKPLVFFLENGYESNKYIYFLSILLLLMNLDWKNDIGISEHDEF